MERSGYGIMRGKLSGQDSGIRHRQLRANSELGAHAMRRVTNENDAVLRIRMHFNIPIGEYVRA